MDETKVQSNVITGVPGARQIEPEFISPEEHGKALEARRVEAEAAANYHERMLASAHAVIASCDAAIGQLTERLAPRGIDTPSYR